jgi:hypothetical protein
MELVITEAALSGKTIAPPTLLDAPQAAFAMSVQFTIFDDWALTNNPPP